MKKWFLHILLLAGLFGMLTTSCSQEEDLDSQASDKKVQVVFTIALDGQSARSRATWGSEYDNNIGNDFDNQINPDQLFVKLTLTDGQGNTNTYDVQNIAYWQEGDINEYKFVGEVPVTLSSTATYTSAKIVVYANVDNVSEAFTTNYSTNPGTGVKYIPMWGVKTISSLSLTPGSMTDLGASNPICLLRSMAKVEVNLSASGFTLTGLSLNKYNTKGNCLPANAGIGNTENLHYDNEQGFCFNPNTTDASSTPLSFTVTNNSLTFYLPEVANSSADELVMTLTLKKGEQTVNLNAPYLYFRNYTSGSADNATPFNVVRNHLYRYNITTINDAIGATLDVVVNDWNTDEEIWDYREHVSVEGSGKMQWTDYKENEDDIDYMVNIQGTNVYVPLATVDNPAICTFRLSTPVGGTWFATFENQTGEYNAFKFLDADGNVVTSVNGNVGEDAILRIITTNTSPTVRSTATLRIAVRTSDNRTLLVKELLPNNDNAEYTLVQSIQ